MDELFDYLISGAILAIKTLWDTKVETKNKKKMSFQDSKDDTYRRISEVQERIDKMKK